MPVVTLPDKSQRTYKSSITVMQVAEDIGAGLAKATLAAKVNGKLVDAAFEIKDDIELAIITAKDKEGLDIIRHSTAHLLAQAVKQLFPTAQVTIGPVIEDGFYYDFAFAHAFTPEDLVKIEKRMAELVKEALPVSRQSIARDKAIQFFKELGEEYKAEIIKDLPEDEILTLYTQGDFTDLCRGPHVPNTRHLKVFKLMKVAGAYWRGDSNNEMLQRIYGTAWASKEDLKTYLHRLEEAEKRDHRRIGKFQELFHQQEEAPGMIFWHEKGWIIWQVIESYIRQQQLEAGYQEIKTPQIVDFSLWQRSGHADKYFEEMFVTHSEKRDYAIKPMNCPCHVQVFNQGLKSYRDLPIRLAEFGACHRNEPSGALHGLFRVRAMVQDDGHIFCTPEQIESEVAAFMHQAFDIYHDFGLTEIRVCIATRPEKRIGADEVWDTAEKALAEALTKQNITFEYLAGEGAFYGPKVELHLKDCLGREWQCGTVQIDFNMPARLNASYVAEDNVRKVPVMLHRATLGSLERFLGMLIEHYAGVFPLWLAPVQAVVMGISEKHHTYVTQVTNTLKKAGFRARPDLRNEKIGFKIREHTLQRVPYMLVTGDKEAENNTITVRTRKGKDLGAMSVEQVIALLNKGVAERGRQAED